MEAAFQTHSLSRALLTSAAPSGFRILLAKYVEMEMEEAWEAKTAPLITLGKGDEVRAVTRQWDLLIRRVNPERVRLHTDQEVKSCAGRIRHKNDEPVLASILIANPSAVITTNRRDFNDQLSTAIGIPIFSPKEYFQRIGAALRSR